MANEEGVKIILTAEDRYTATIKKIEASTKLFGETTKNTERHLAALEKEMIRLVANGLDPANKKIVEMKANYDRLSQSLGSSSNSLKKNNMQWTNLALVVQDLPYGFRGIQNNLPALMGGFAKMTGPIYLAGSAIIAFFAAYEMGLFDALTATSAFEEANKKAIESVSKEATEIALLVAQYKNSNTSAAERKAIIEDLNKINPQYFGNLDKEKTSISTLNQAYLAYVNNLGNVIKAKKLEEELTKKIEKRLKFEYEAGIDLLKTGYRNPELINQQNKALKTHNQMLQEEADLAQRITSLSKVVIPTKDDKPTKEKKDVDTSYLNRLKEEQKTYKDNIYMFYHYGELIIDEEDRIAKERAKIAKTLSTQINNIEAATVAKRIANKQELGMAIMAEADKNTKTFEDEERAQVDAAKKGYKELLSEFEQFYVDRRNLSTGNREQQKILYEQEASDLQYMLDNGFISYDDYLKRIGEAFKGWANNNKAISKEAFQDMQKLGIGIMNALGPSLDMLLEKGASIGEVLSRAFQDIIKKLIKVAIAAAVAVAVISLIPGMQAKVSKAGGALKMFGGLVAGGMGLGADLFSPTAKGGIFSGPSYRLVGEYPGAANNPEVVAPLDKLQSMIGSSNGVGQLEARISGNDLLILMNRTERNNQSTF